MSGIRGRGALVAVIVAWIIGFCLAQLNATNTLSPNIIVVLIDDLDYVLGGLVRTQVFYLNQQS